MASDAQDRLFDVFQAVTAQPEQSTSPVLESEVSVTNTLDRVMSQVAQLAASGAPGSAGTSGTSEAVDAIVSGLHASEASGAQPAASQVSDPDFVNVSAEAGSRLNTTPTTESINQNASSSSSGGGTSALSIASSVLGSGLGIIPLVGGLISLFGGGSSQPPPLERYVMPDRLYFTGDDTPNGIQDADYDQFGMPRLYNDITASGGSQMGSPAGGPGVGTTSNVSQGSSGSQINVTIQALDSQSFLDRSNDIAQAVRQAMLSSNSINDVVNDL